MIKNFWLILACALTCIVSLNVYATQTPSKYYNCPNAEEPSSPNFCPSFKSVAICHCEEALPRGLPKSICSDMNRLYDLMVARYGSLQGACQSQKDTPAQVCIDSWNCYRYGGNDSHGKLCSSNGNKC